MVLQLTLSSHSIIDVCKIKDISHYQINILLDTDQKCIVISVQAITIRTKYADQP